MTAQQLRNQIDAVKAEIEPLIEKRDKLQIKLLTIQRNCSHERAIQTGRAVGQMGVGHVPYRFKCPDCLATYVKVRKLFHTRSK